MVRLASSFYNKIQAVATNRIGSMLENISSASACAGIRGNGEAEDENGPATRAYNNHYGSFSKKVPARRWVTMADIRLPRTNAVDILQQELKDMLRSDTGPTKTIQEMPDYFGGYRVQYHMGSVFAPGVRSKTIQNRIAELMAEAQREAIITRNFRAGPTNGGDPYNNAKSTIARKGFNRPLFKTYEMFGSIEAWTE